MDRYEERVKELRIKLYIAAGEKGIGDNPDQRWDFTTNAILMIKDFADEEYKRGYRDGYDTAYLDWKEGKQ